MSVLHIKEEKKDAGRSCLSPGEMGLLCGAGSAPRCTTDRGGDGAEMSALKPPACREVSEHTDCQDRPVGPVLEPA